MATYTLENAFEQFDEYRPVKLGYLAAIDFAGELARDIREAILNTEVKLAEDVAVSPNRLRDLGALAQLWKSPTLNIPQKPSSLGALLVLGSLGAAGGYAAGGLADWLIPGDTTRLRRLGAAVGGGIGSLPGLSSMAFNLAGKQPVLTSSFWDWDDRQTKAASFINVHQFNDEIWNNPQLATRLPPTIQAAASGLITGASNLPGKHKNSIFVTPMDVARMAMGMGSGAASGWLVGQALGTAFGTSPKLRKTLINTGAMAGLIKNVIPMVYQGPE